MKTDSRRFHHPASARKVLKAAYALIYEQRLDCIPRKRFKELAAGVAEPLESFHLRRCVACRIGLATAEVEINTSTGDGMCPGEVATAGVMTMSSAATAPEQVLDSLFGAIRGEIFRNTGKPDTTLAAVWPLINDLKKCSELAAQLEREVQRRYALRYASMVRAAQPAVRIVLIYAIGCIQETLWFATPIVQEIAAMNDPLVRRLLAATLRTEAPNLTKVIASERWSSFETVPGTEQGLEAFKRFVEFLIPPATRTDGLRELFGTVENMAHTLFTSRDAETTICSLMTLRQYLGEVTNYAYGTFQSEIIAALSVIRKVIYQRAFDHRAAEFLAVEACAKTWKIDKRETRIESAAQRDTRSRKEDSEPATEAGSVVS